MPYLWSLEFSNDPLERLLTQYNKPRPATPSFIMMIATNTGSRPSNQLAILQQALKERVKKCVLLQNPCSTLYGRQITFKDFYMMWWKGQPHSVQQNSKCIHYSDLLSKAIASNALKRVTLWKPNFLKIALWEQTYQKH